MRPTIILIILTLLSFSKLTAQSPEKGLEPQLRIDPQGHAGVVNALAFTPEGNTLISVSADKTIRLWDVETGLLNRTIRTQSDSGPEGAIYTASLSSDGQYLAIGGYFNDNEVRLINLQRTQPVVLLKGHKNVITKVVFSLDGRLLASASADKSINIWQLTFNEGKIQGELYKTLTGHEQTIYDIAFAPDGKKLVSASADGSLRLWDLTEDTSPVVMRMHVDKVYSCAYSADGRYIVSGGSKGKVLAWNNDGSFKSIMGTMETGVGQLNFTDDNKLFASARAVNIYTVPSGTVIGIIPKQGKNITAAAVYKHKYFATSASATGEIIIRDIENQTTVSTIAGTGILAAEVASNDKGVIALGSKSRSLGVAFDLNKLKFLFSNFNKEEFTGAITATGGYSLDKMDSYTLSTGFKGAVKNDPALDGRILRYTVVDNDKIAVGSDFSLKLYTRDGQYLKTLSGANGAVTALAIDHSLNYLIAGFTDETIRVWDIDSGNLIVSLFFSNNNDWICWTPKGYYQASAGGEKYLGWHINQGADKLASFYPAYVFAKTFHQPEVVQQTIRLRSESEALAYLDVKEKKIVDTNLNVATEAPLIEWLSPELSESKANKSRVMIKARIRSSTPIKTVKILINGRPAPQSRGINSNEDDMLVEQEILLLNEVNKVKIFVSNENAKTVSESRTIYLPKAMLSQQKGSNTQIIDYTAKPDLFILGIGISEYQNESYNLNFADDDAESITNLFSTIGRGNYKQIHLEQVLNKDATKKKILNSFAWLYQNATSKDIVIIFIASHGFNKEGEFYILPTDGDANRLAETGISWENLANTLGKLPAKVLLMVDACYSGQLGTNIEYLESNNTEAVRAISGEEVGVVIMAASTGDETSQEFENWGHGAFTLSVLEGLEQGKADIKNDMTIFLRELDFYVSERTIELTNGQQHPTTQKPSSVGRFPILTIDN